MRARLLIALIVAAAIAAHAGAQSSAEVNVGGLQFNLLNPGARSLGLGGAFSARADDATAAYANPAGLLNLTRPEVSAEVRTWDYSNFYPDRGHAFGPPTQRGTDTIEGVVDSKSRDQVFGFSYFSYVYPSLKGKWALALYRHELGAFKSSARSAGMFFGPDQPNRFYPTASDLTLDIDSLGAALAYRLDRSDRLKPYLSVGVSVARYQSDFQSETRRYSYDVFAPGGLYAPPRYAPENVLSIQRQAGHDATFGWNAGLLWTPNESVSVGLVYKRGTSFDLRVTSTEGPLGEHPGTVDYDVVTQFHVPTAYGLGVAYRWPGNTQVSFDLNRVLYSSMTRDFVTFLDAVDDPHKYRVSNGTEVHAGFERYFSHGDIPLFIWRVGGWRDPDHHVYYADASNPQSLLFRRGQTDWHVAAGIGREFGKYQLNVGFDRSRSQRIVSVSVVRLWRSGS